MTKLKDVQSAKKIKEELQKVKPPVELISYTIRATIPTMMYGNIQPEITVKADTIAQASFFVLDHINWLYKNYCEDPRDGKTPKFMQNIEVKPTIPMTPTTSKTVIEPEKNLINYQGKPALLKASQAIKNCLSNDALNIIKEQINVSVKLTDEDKLELIPLLKQKYNDLNPS